jgi:glycerol-3-phosphate O-acyltransferase
MDSPIFRLNADRTRLVETVVQRILAAKTRSAADVEFWLNDTAFWEIARLETEGSASAQLRDWLDLYRTLGRKQDTEKAALLHSVVTGYARDIVGNFNPQVYRLASRLIPKGLSLLYRRQALQVAGGLDHRITIQGHIDTLRKLCEQGTVILMPTHSSNLDSILVGYALDRLGLPPFTYGAGKNLFGNRFIGYFMHNLGAYKVDRRLRHDLYKDTLKAYSTLLLESGYHSLFFPGGTRSRSGSVEKKLKLGLAGTGVTAYVNNVIAGSAKPNLYVVPVTINYPLVLEGASQIDDYLKAVGRSRYIIEDDEFSRLAVIWKYFQAVLNFEGKVFLQIGAPLDIFGNPVDDEGRSLDPRGRLVDPRSYVRVRGVPAHDRRRDEEYARELGVSVLDGFARNNVVLCTNLVAFALFRWLVAAHPNLDVYHLIRLPGDTAILRGELARLVERVRDQLFTLHHQGRLLLSPTVQTADVTEILNTAFEYFRAYHTRHLVALVGEAVHLQDVRLLFYYHNRLSGYGLETLFPTDRSHTVKGT